MLSLNAFCRKVATEKHCTPLSINSPDLSTCNFWLSHEVSMALEDTHFESNQYLKATVPVQLKVPRVSLAFCHDFQISISKGITQSLVFSVFEKLQVNIWNVVRIADEIFEEAIYRKRGQEKILQLQGLLYFWLSTTMWIFEGRKKNPVTVRFISNSARNIFLQKF